MTTRERYKQLNEEALGHIEKRKQRGLDYGPGGRVWSVHNLEAQAQGEIGMALPFGSNPDFRGIMHPDGGADNNYFLYVPKRPDFYKMDAKGVWKNPNFLVVGIGYVRPNTAYMQFYRPNGWTWESDFPWPCNGWMWGHEVMTYPVEDFWGGGRLGHVVPSREPNKLHLLEELLAMYGHRWFHGGLRKRWAIYCEDQ